MKISPLLVLMTFLLLSCGVNPSGSMVEPGTTDLPDLGVTPTVSTIAVPETVELPDLGTAPELSNQVWINTDQPLRLADLRGRVILLEMWTFG